MSIDINRLDLNILMILAKEQSTDELKGMTINEINSYYEGQKLSARANLSKRIRRLHDMKLIEKGIKDVTSDTFYITEGGLTAIKWNGGNENE